MRELKFRAWSEQYEEMYEVDVLAINHVTWDSSGTGVSLAYQPHVKVMQYTGLKDKNGREIYEDDIVVYTKISYTDCSRTEIEDIQEPIIGAIYYAEGVWLGIKYADGTGKLFLPGQVSSEESNLEIEIVGNIYENPDQLGDAK